MARIRRFGISGLRSDDFMVFFALVNFTLLCYSLNHLIDRGGKNNYMSEGAAALLTPDEVAYIVANGKWVFVQEHLMLGVLWSAKFSVLIIYWRITFVLFPRTDEVPLG